MKCEWKDENEYFSTGCGNSHCFTADGIKENDYLFCPYCGNEIEEKVETLEEWMEAEGYDKETVVEDITIHLKKCHSWTIWRENKKHQPKQSFEEWWRKCILYNSDRPCVSFPKEAAEESWKACEKNRGYDD